MLVFLLASHILRGGNRSKQLYHHRREINLGKCFVVDAPSYGSRSSSVLGERDDMAPVFHLSFEYLLFSFGPFLGW